MDAVAAQRAAEMLWGLWRTGATIDTLPGMSGRCRSTTGGRSSVRSTAMPGDGSAGRSPAAASPGSSTSARTARWQVRSYDGTVFRGGATVPLRTMRVAEAEFAFVMGADLPAGRGPYRVTVLDAVAELRPAWERRTPEFVDPVAAGAAQMCAEAASARHLSWRTVELAARVARSSGGLLSSGGRVVASGVVTRGAAAGQSPSCGGAVHGIRSELVARAT